MTRAFNGTTLRLVHGDITDAEVDAIVNAANGSLMGGGGVDGAIHRLGGPAILEACLEIRRSTHPHGLPTGQAVTTTAGDLPAQHVIHTVGPVWHGGDRDEPSLLADAYRHALDQARKHNLRTVAFPSISTGAYGFPIDRAAPIALGTARAFIQQHPGIFDEIRFVLFSADDFETYQRALDSLS